MDVLEDLWIFVICYGLSPLGITAEPNLVPGTWDLGFWTWDVGTVELAEDFLGFGFWAAVVDEGPFKFSLNLLVEVWEKTMSF